MKSIVSILYSFAALFFATSLIAGNAAAQGIGGILPKVDNSSTAAAHATIYDPALTRAIDDTFYKFVSAQGGFRADNAAQHLSMKFLDASTSIDTRGGTLELCLSGYGVPIETKVDGKKLQRTYHGIREWFMNDAAGLEQGFEVEEKPAEFVIRVAVDGGWTATADSENLAFTKDGVSIQYSGLKAWDARGTLLNARMRPVSGGFEIRVDDIDAIYPVTVDPVLTQQGYLTDSRAQYLGNSVAISADGNTALIGAYGSTVGTISSEGAVFVFTRSGESWAEQAELLEPVSGPNAGGPSDLFGVSVSLSADGSTALIGASGRHNGGGFIDTGGAFIFTRSGNTWSQSAFLYASGAEGFGNFVSLSADGKTALALEIAAPTAFLFGQSPTTGVWSLEATLATNDLAGIQASETTLSGDASTAMIQVGGKMYVFAGHGPSWSQQQVLTASSNSVSLSTNGNTALIGNAYESGGGTAYDMGAAYVFTRSAGVWTQRARLTAPATGLGAAAPYDYFGYSVALSPDGTVAMIGAPGKNVGSNTFQGEAYEFTGGGNAWALQQVLIAPSSGVGSGAAYDRFGNSVAVSPEGATGLVAAYTKNGTTSGQGAVYSYYAVNITITSNLTGLPFTVTGTNCQAGSYSTPVILIWTPGAACTVTFDTPISGLPTIQYVFTTWENASTDPSRFIVAPTGDTTYTATFKTQYKLTTQASPILGGSIKPAAGFFDAGSKVIVTALSRTGYVFYDFTGALTGNTNPQQIILNAPATVTANFHKIILK